MKTIKFSLILLAFMAFAQTTWAQLPCLPGHGLTDDVTAWCGETQTLELSEGWNWVSFYVEADDLLEQLEAGLGENGLMIEGLGGTTENLGDGFWLGSLDDVGVSLDQMYFVQTSSSCTVTLEGVAANPLEVEITLDPGWNWIGFPCDEEVVILEVVGFEPEESDMIEGAGGVTEHLGDGFWLGEIETLVPGQGYMYYSSSADSKTLVFRLASKKR